VRIGDLPRCVAVQNAIAASHSERVIAQQRKGQFE
jgi:hypothetical protein